jgi:hypothetical protein
MCKERSISLAAIVVMLCCMGNVVGTCPVSNSNARISTVVVHTQQSDFDDQVSRQLEAPERTSSCFVVVDVPEQIEFEELQNLPPPAVAV